METNPGFLFSIEMFFFGAYPGTVLADTVFDPSQDEHISNSLMVPRRNSRLYVAGIRYNTRAVMMK